MPNVKDAKASVVDMANRVLFVSSETCRDLDTFIHRDLEAVDNISGVQRLFGSLSEKISLFVKELQKIQSNGGTNFKPYNLDSNALNVVGPLHIEPKSEPKNERNEEEPILLDNNPILCNGHTRPSLSLKKTYDTPNTEDELFIKPEEDALSSNTLPNNGKSD